MKDSSTLKYERMNYIAELSNIFIDAKMLCMRFKFGCG